MNARTRQRGYSLLEVMIVLMIAAILAAVSMPVLLPALRSEQDESSFQLVRRQFQLARQYAISQRCGYTVAMTSKAGAALASIQVSQMTGCQGRIPASTVTIPKDFNFVILSGVPTQKTQRPDQLGNGSDAIDLDSNNSGVVRTTFYPDGTAHNNAGQYADGVVYFARTGTLASSRAITVMGYTGRIQAWRLQKTASSSYFWGKE